MLLTFVNVYADTGNVSHVIRFEDNSQVLRGSKIDLNGVPFMVVGSRLMECHQGPTHVKGNKDKVRLFVSYLVFSNMQLWTVYITQRVITALAY